MRRWWALVGLGMWLGLSAAAMAAGPRSAEAYMPLSQVRPGMQGVFKTVVEGTRVESFPVDVVGVLPDAGPRGDLIVIRASDEMMERTGGIASGMSGSPVYVDGRLIGALGFGLSLSDHRVGLLTPIEEMARLYELVEDEDDGYGEEDGEGAGNGAARAGRLPRISLTEAVAGLPRDAQVVPLSTPILAGGLSSRAFQRLAADLEPLGLGPLRLSGGSAAGGLAEIGEGAVPFEPGSAFGIQLVRGDVNVAAIGTVTDVDGQRFIALAHPFINRGDTAFLASGAYVHDIFRTLASPFKVASPLATVGAVLQDRGAGVAGRTGVEPPVTRVKVQVWDADRHQDVTYEADVVQDEALMVPLISAVVFSAADRALDRLGRGTVRIVYQVEGEGMPRPLLRTNLTFSEFDAAGSSLFEVLDAVRTLVDNPFQDVKISEVRVALDVEQERRIALVEAARPLPQRVRPGDTVEIDVTLRPFRRETVRKRVRLTVPEDALPGPVNVVVRAGGWAGEPAAEGNAGDGRYSERNIDDLAALIDRMMEREHNNELIAEFYPRRESFGEGEGGWYPGADVHSESPDGRPWSDAGEPFPPGGAPYAHEAGWHAFDPAGRVFERVTTPYVLTGSVDFELFITEREGPWTPSESPLLAPL